MEERRRRERLVSKELLELLVLAVNGKETFVGNLSDISDFGMAILSDFEIIQNQEIGSRISGIISGPCMDDINFSGVIVRKDKVATSGGMKGIIGVEFHEMIQLSDRLLALSLTTSE
ncbi:type IV pilus assembly protein PilZ [Leptospira inadai serovar Lyme str. 10]|uniref:Type IV pilus assembly protein PilZ n=2 Tax=Leptospira inadai serovar Lyme TaxID=293084 RepID=V6HAE7_9LEPT|nr:PilZ domain-containing protein [Leptospira inadai]EQA36351.1 type IV pilus assembly protein PilZ [Leptospira inadai serovar Lyme str. 10]PNV73650.1 PilZ domain-containing protein [Leptospira inadai serovar Lyme]